MAEMQVLSSPPVSERRERKEAFIKS